MRGKMRELIDPKKVLSRNATIDERSKEAVNKPRDFMDEDDVEMVSLSSS